MCVSRAHSTSAGGVDSGCLQEAVQRLRGWSGVRGEEGCVRVLWMGRREKGSYNCFTFSCTAEQLTAHSTQPPHTALQTPPCTLPSSSLESNKFERVGGYQLTMTQIPNSFAFGGGNVNTFQPHRMSFYHIMAHVHTHCKCHLFKDTVVS